MNIKNGAQLLFAACLLVAASDACIAQNVKNVTLKSGDTFESLVGTERLTFRKNGVVDIVEKGAMFEGRYSILDGGQVRITAKMFGSTVVEKYQAEKSVTSIGLSNENDPKLETGWLIPLSEFESYNCNLLAMEIGGVAPFASPKAYYHTARGWQSFFQAHWKGESKSYTHEDIYAGSRAAVRMTRKGCHKVAIWDSQGQGRPLVTEYAGVVTRLTGPGKFELLSTEAANARWQELERAVATEQDAVNQRNAAIQRRQAQARVEEAASKAAEAKAARIRALRPMSDTPWSSRLEKFYLAANAGSFSTARAMLSSDAKQALNGALGALAGGFVGAMNDFTKNGTIERIRLESEQRRGELATVTSVIYYRDGTTKHDKTNMILENGKWMVGM